MGIVAKVVEPTEWVSPMIVVAKPNGDVRICLDPADLNEAIQRPHYAVPSADELFGRLSKARFFTVLDATSGFWKIPLTDPSSYFTTMATPFGRYRFKASSIRNLFRTRGLSAKNVREVWRPSRYRNIF